MQKLKCAVLGLVAILLVGIVVRGAVIPVDSQDAWVQLARGTEEGFRQAKALSPFSSAPWLALGLLAEQEGKLEQAREFLARGVALDRGYQPRWTLGSFYLRHHDRQAWLLLAEALRIAIHGGQETSSLFEACWQFRPEGDFLLNHLIATSADALPLYVTFLLNTQHDTALAQAALRLAASGNTANKELLMRASDRLLASGEAPVAKQIWDQVSTPEPKLELLSNSALRAPQQLGFDWRYNSLPESRIEFDHGAKFDFDGKQPDPLELIFQPVSLSRGAYTFTWESRQTPAELPSGAFWQATDWRTGVEVFRSPFATPADWQASTQTFRVGDARLIRLAMRIERVPGSVRFAGTVWLRNLHLRAQ